MALGSDGHNRHPTGPPKLFKRTHLTARSRSRPRATLYDAVAERVTSAGFKLNKELRYREFHIQQNATLPPSRPEEVLFRALRAPERYAESDIYDMDRHLTPDSDLPDSDLLKAIHMYAADFYGGQFPMESYISHYSMDETALLAMGILLEEAARFALGKTGDLALVEGRVQKAEDTEDLATEQVKGFTSEDLPSVRQPPSTQAFFRGQILKPLGFTRFTHAESSKGKSQ